MKTITYSLLAVLSIGMMKNANACSQEVNQLFDKNLLVAYAAGDRNVDLAKATSIAINDYAYNYSGVDSGSNCSAYLNSQARITVNYKPNPLMSCTLSVTIRKIEQVGITPDLSHPMLDIVSESPISSCKRIPIVIGSINLPNKQPLQKLNRI
jgi:hypothetical protein